MTISNFKNEIPTFKTKNILLLFVSFITFITLILPLHAEIPRLAILDFKANENVSEEIAGDFSNFVKKELLTAGLYEIVPSAAMQIILLENKKKHLQCSESDCALEIGRLLSARKIMFGTISRFGGKYVIVARIVDIERGRIEIAKSVIAVESKNLENAATRLVTKIRTFHKKKGGRKIITMSKIGVVDKKDVWLRSLIFPGWGHFYIREYEMGALFGIGAIVALNSLFIEMPERLRSSYLFADLNAIFIPFVFDWHRRFNPENQFTKMPNLMIAEYIIRDFKNQLIIRRRIRRQVYSQTIVFWGLTLFDLSVFRLRDAKISLSAVPDRKSKFSYNLALRVQF